MHSFFNSSYREDPNIAKLCPVSRLLGKSWNSASLTPRGLTTRWAGLGHAVLLGRPNGVASKTEDGASYCQYAINIKPWYSLFNEILAPVLYRVNRFKLSVEKSPKPLFSHPLLESAVARCSLDWQITRVDDVHRSNSKSPALRQVFLNALAM